MADPFLGQILGSVLGQAMGGGRSGPFGGGGPGGGNSGGGLGGVLGGMLGGRGMGSGGYSRGGMGMGGMGGMGGGRTALLALMLPLAMQWVQRNGGIGNVLQRAGQKGYSRQAASWVGTGENESISPEAVDQLVGREELSRMSRQLGVGEDEVAHGFAEILPEMVDQLSPQGQIHDDADRRLEAGQSSLARMLEDLQQRETMR